MVKVYSDQSIALVGVIRSYLEENNIASQIRNEFSSGVLGVIPFANAWPEIWVAEADQGRALGLINDMQKPAPAGADWFCQQCKESNPGTFEVCWQCGAAK